MVTVRRYTAGDISADAEAVLRLLHVPRVWSTTEGNPDTCGASTFARRTEGAIDKDGAAITRCWSSSKAPDHGCWGCPKTATQVMRTPANSSLTDPRSWRGRKTHAVECARDATRRKFLRRRAKGVRGVPPRRRSL